MDVERLREEVISQIRACLISTKGACKLGQIRRDYEMLMGEDIPYTKLGYKTLEQFICSIPTLQTTRSNGQLLVDAKITDKSAHISHFVQKQKTKKRSRLPPRQNFDRRQVAPSRWRPGSVTQNWKTTYETSPRPAAYAHKQVVSSSKSPKKTNSNVHSRLSIKEENNYSPQHSPPLQIPKQQQIDDSLTKKAKQRISQRMAKLTCESNDIIEPSLPLQISNILNRQLSDTHEITLAERRKFESNVIQAPKVGTTVYTKTGDYWADLKVFAERYNLGPVTVKTIPKKNRNRTMYYCTIQISEQKYSNYPEDNFDETSARQVASRKALDELEPKHQNKQTCLSISSIPDILKRVPPMVQEHSYGVWSSLIEENYAKLYNETLPGNWREIVDSLPCIAVQQIHDSYVLNYCSSNEVFQKTNYSNPNTTPNVSVPPNTVSFNDDGMLIAEITCISSAAEIWCAQRETVESDLFLQMVQEMEDFYNSEGIYNKASNIQMGGHYVALYEQMWGRVRVFEVNEDNIHCFCIDYGDEWIIQKENLYNLQSKFGTEPAQAFVCRLAGLEELYEVSKTSEYLHSFLNKFVQVQEENQHEDLETAAKDPVLPVVFYDMETGSPINEEIITYMSMEIATVSLVLNSPTEVYVTHALDDGSVYIQIRSKGYEHLMSLIEKAGQTILENKSSIKPANVTKTDNGEELYLILHTDGLWYRIKIIDWSPGPKKFAQILFVDNGQTNIVEVTNIKFYTLSDISDVISKFPFQGLHVKLQLKEVPSDFVQKVTKLMPPSDAVVVKALRMDTDYIHIVEFFKRSEPENILFSVNMTITADVRFKNAEGDGNNNNKPQSKKLQRLISLNQFDDMSSKNVPSTGSLSCPPIPKLNEFFDVKIPCAVHPHNFFVQPYNSQDQLNKLMVHLQERYNKDIQYSPIQLNDILPGKIYASRHADGKWYRTSVIKVINSSSISVFYCDFGYYGSLTSDQLYPIDNEFMKLPYQAIKAKLADIQPKYSNWSVEDCNFFCKLVSKKSFVSILQSIEKDVLYQSDIVLNLKLIDTSQSADIHIDELLINEGKAVSSI